jgi:MerR family transcriptional regulator, heat shock protein HspR
MNRRGRDEGRIPHDVPLFQISVVARMVGLHQQTIRSYERVGLIEPARSAGNTRLYSQEDVARLQQVVRLVNDLGVNLAGVEVILRMREQIEELTAELERTRGELARLRGDARPPAHNDHGGTGGDGR